jgi:hypothetical protein
MLFRVQTSRKVMSDIAHDGDSAGSSASWQCFDIGAISGYEDHPAKTE